MYTLNPTRDLIIYIEITLTIQEKSPQKMAYQ